MSVQALRIRAVAPQSLQPAGSFLHVHANLVCTCVCCSCLGVTIRKGRKIPKTHSCTLMRMNLRVGGVEEGGKIKAGRFLKRNNHTMSGISKKDKRQEKERSWRYWKSWRVLEVLEGLGDPLGSGRSWTVLEVREVMEDPGVLGWSWRSCRSWKILEFLEGPGWSWRS